ncbi:hypothetical protein EWB00_004434, partial [Schistosoma japonicum]
LTSVETTLTAENVKRKEYCLQLGSDSVSLEFLNKFLGSELYQGLGRVQAVLNVMWNKAHKEVEQNVDEFSP